MTRCAIYARYSSDRQSPSSIADQVRKCRQYASAKGWDVLDDCVYIDEAISGTITDRPGLNRLLAAAKAKAFDIVLFDDTSRLSRKLSDALNLSDRLKFYGVRVVFVSQGIDSDSEQAEVLVATHGVVDSLYIRELATKTRRGIEGCVMRHQHHGGRVFGYRSVPIEDPERRDQYGRPIISGARLVVSADEAKVVIKIFQLYAAGMSLKAVTKGLNAERLRSPQPRKGREQSWTPSSIRHILHNERYNGRVVWAKTKKIRNPETGRRVQRKRRDDEHVIVPMPEQKIVSDALWKSVQDRLAFVKKTYGEFGAKGGRMNGRAAASPYLFSGLLKCGVCGSNFVLVCGAGRGHKTADYGCPAHALRGTCTNARRVSRDTVERELLAKIQRDVLADAVIDYTLKKLEAEIERRFAAVDRDMQQLRKHKAELDTKIERLTRALESGDEDMPSVRKMIVDREAELRAITTKIVGTKKDSVSAQIAGLRKFVKDNMADVRGVLRRKYENVLPVRQLLRRYVEEIVILPDADDPAVIKYSGKWNLLGTGADDIGGAEGQS